MDLLDYDVYKWKNFLQDQSKMIISQPLGLEQNETHKSAYFGDAMPSPLSLTASVPSVGHSSISGSSQGIYAPSDGYFLPSRVQTDLPNMSMYVAQPETTSISSPGNYASNPASVATAPGLMGSHYAAGLQHPPCYPSLGEDYEMRSGVGGVWHGSYAQPPPSCYPYDNSFTPQYPYDRYCGMDINDGVRRKNATRESTNTLKAWLQEHKKNPYPTKGEKIMLAIITKMTLTQVSTWFANARRRLKKENKMTWVPKNRSSDSSNAGSKKTDDEDDDDVTSHLSQENDCKSDNENSIDSDDSDSRKVTSTNIGDDVTTTSPDVKEASNEFSNERGSVTSDGTCHQHSEEREFCPQVNEDQLHPNYGHFDHAEKPWSSISEGVDHKPPKPANPQGISSPYESTVCYPNSSTMLPQQNANSAISRSGDICPSNELKYTPDWTPTSYPGYSSVPRVDTQRPRDQLKNSQSPAQDTEAKPSLSNRGFSINPVSESTSPSAPSYAQGFHHQRSQQTIEYYRNMALEPPYFPHNEVNSSAEMKSDRVQGYPNIREQMQPKTPNYSVSPSPSHSSTDTSSSNQKPLYQHNLSPQYYPNSKMIKQVSPATTTAYTGSFFQQENFNQRPSLGNSIEYYQRKDFYSPETHGYHIPSSSSPRK